PGMMMVPSRDMNQVPFYLRFRMPPHPNYHEYSPPDERPLLSANQRCLLGGISFVLVAAFGTAMYFCKPEEEKTGSRRGSVKKSAQTETAAQEDEQPAPEPEDLESLIEQGPKAYGAIALVIALLFAHKYCQCKYPEDLRKPQPPGCEEKGPFLGAACCVFMYFYKIAHCLYSDFRGLVCQGCSATGDDATRALCEGDKNLD
ncbi:unnamed protein product, partial [Notodromas monacha]